MTRILMTVFIDPVLVTFVLTVLTWLFHSVTYTLLRYSPGDCCYSFIIVDSYSWYCDASDTNGLLPIRHYYYIGIYGQYLLLFERWPHCVLLIEDAFILLLLLMVVLFGCGIVINWYSLLFVWLLTLCHLLVKYCSVDLKPIADCCDQRPLLTIQYCLLFDIGVWPTIVTNIIIIIRYCCIDYGSSIRPAVTSYYCLAGIVII